jgi:hypothetical protein
MIESSQGAKIPTNDNEEPYKNHKEKRVGGHLKKIPEALH